MFLPYIHFFALLVYLYLAFFILSKDAKSWLNRSCSVLLVCFALWNFSDIFSSYFNLADRTVHLVHNISSLGWASFPSVLLYFSLAFSQKENILRKKPFLLGIASLPVLFVYKQWTNCLTTDFQAHPFGWTYSWSNTIWPPLFYLYYSSFTILSIYVVYQYGRKSGNLVQKQAKIIAFCIGIGLIGGTIADVVIPEIGLVQAPGLGNVIILVFALGLVYAVVKYKLMTITPAFASEAILSTIDEFLVFLDREANIVSANKSLEESLGYRRDELKGKSLGILLKPDNSVDSLRERMIKGETLRNWETTLHTKRGEEIPVIFSACPLRDSKKVVVGFLFVARDITERKKAEEELRKREEEYRTIFENLPCGVYRTTPGEKGKYLMVNDTLVKMCGFDSEEELKKVSPADLNVDPAKRKLFSDTLLAKGSVEGMEFKLRKKDGTHFWGLVNARVMYDKDGANPYFDCTIVDITERKRLEQELIESEKRYRTLLENVPVAVYRTTPGPKGKFLMANPATLKIFGFDSEEEIKKIDTCDVYVHPEEREVFSRTLLSKGRVDGVVLALKRKNGDVFFGEVTARVVQEKGGKETYFECSIVDITERKKAEEEKEKLQAQLLQMQKMEAIGMLAGGVAHDFNNLLTIIQGCNEMAMCKISKKDPAYEDLKQIEHAAQRAADLTRQLLLFSRKQSLKPSSLNINEVVDSVLKMLRRVIGEDVMIDIVLDPQVWRVWADRASVEQVIMNLSINARDAMPEGGRLTIRTENVIIDQHHCKFVPEARPGNYVCLSVQDTGVGMDKDTITRIFDPFFTTKSSGERMGLGLSVVYGIVKEHKGWISVDSEPHKGSTFKVYLPAFLKEEDKEEKMEMETGVLRGNGEVVLVVEDEKGVRDLVTETLRTNGYLVFEACDAKEALQIFEKERGNFHLIFSDIVLPDRDGLELAGDLLSRKPELKFLLTSGYTDKKAHLSLVRKRGFHFIQKPYGLKGLLQAVKEALSHGR